MPVADPPVPDTLTSRADRLGGLPYTRRHGRVLLGSGTGWALDAMDVGLISFVGAALAAQWSLSLTEQSWLLSIGFVGMAIGAALGGRLADRYGRRTVFAATMVLYGLATGASALVTGLAALLLLRFVVGLGLGAELPVASTLVSELSPTRIRGRMVVILEAFWAVGWVLAALIGYFVVQPYEDGWRYAFLIGLVPALYAVVVRLSLPESPLFLERRGRGAEAEAVVRDFERAAGRPAPQLSVRPGPAPEEAAPVEAAPAPEAAPVKAAPLPEEVVPVQAAPAPVAGPAASVWAPEHRRSTAALWVVWFCVNFSYYGAFIWLPSLLVDRGFDLVHSFGYVLVITLAQLPGYAVAAVLIERWGRRPTLGLMLLGSAVAAAAFGSAGSVPQILLAGCALSFFNLGAWGALYAITPETYPTALRGTGAGAAAGFGRIASVLAPLSVPVLLGLVGGVGLFVVFAAAFGLAAVAAATLPERRGTALLA